MHYKLDSGTKLKKHDIVKLLAISKFYFLLRENLHSSPERTDLQQSFQKTF